MNSNHINTNNTCVAGRSDELPSLPCVRAECAGGVSHLVPHTGGHQLPFSGAASFGHGAILPLPGPMPSNDQLPIVIPAEYINTFNIAGSSAVGMDCYLHGGGGGHDATVCGGGGDAGKHQPASVHV